MPERIQRQRSKGWRLPEGAVIVDRTSRWGNPFKVGEPIADPTLFGVSVAGAPLTRQGTVEDRAHAVELFVFWVMAKVPFTEADVREKLAGKDLACFCPPDEPCHADVLLEIANQ